jgi:predicted flavoprotein YhiN
VLGAKILVSGGGRCNVTHHEVDETAFNGSTPAAIRKVLRRFDVAPTIAFFRELGVELEREETGKLFPVTDRARTVLDALIGAAPRGRRRAAASVPGDGRRARRRGLCSHGLGTARTMRARRVLLATGGRSLPKTGSGRRRLRARGVARPHPDRADLPGAGAPRGAGREFRARAQRPERSRAAGGALGSGRKRTSIHGSLLCTHFGLSGPAALDISRHLLDARMDEPGTRLVVRWLPDQTAETLDAALRGPRRRQRGRFPRRSPSGPAGRALCAEAGVDPRDCRASSLAGASPCPRHRGRQR